MIIRSFVIYYPIGGQFALLVCGCDFVEGSTQVNSAKFAKSNGLTKLKVRDIERLGKLTQISLLRGLLGKEIPRS